VPLVGDAVITGRQTIPDMPQTLAPPVLGAAISSLQGTLPIGTYFIVATVWSPWGESAVSNEITFTTTQIGGIQVAFTVGAFGLIPPWFTKIRFYIGLASGAENAYVDYTSVLNPLSPQIIGIIPLTAGQTPPQVSRAWNPDSDGPFISAAAVFGWLNDGLTMISRQTGGLLDYSGVRSFMGQPFYTITGQWNEITSVWYDGYWMTGGDRGQFFRRNSITSQILSSASISVVNGLNVLELYPQPARTAALTTLASAMGIADTSAALTSAAGFVLPFGFMQVDSEIMAYAAIAGNTMTGLLRGLGGTVAATHALTAPVQELNIFWSGRRMFTPAYSPGQGISQLPVPAGWEVLLGQYISGRSKLVEHDAQGWQAFNSDMEKAVKTWAATTKGVMRRRQVGGLSGPAVLYPDIAGGIILPAMFPIVYVLQLKFGGVPWQLSIFTLCLTLVAMKYGTWGKKVKYMMSRYGRKLVP
jgi:hypothetical protein